MFFLRSDLNVLISSEIFSTAHGAVVTQGAIDKISDEIKTLRSDLKKNIQSKNEMFSTKVTTQKQHDLFVNQQKTIEEQVKNIKDFVAEIEDTVKTVEGKIKEEVATKKVIETQKEAFKATQKLTDAEEQLNSTRVVGEKKKEELTSESKDCKKKLDIEAANVKKVQE
jgi:MinD-like ATPase involved in chromosome partitioning or flagellar assembly